MNETLLQPKSAPTIVCEDGGFVTEDFNPREYLMTYYGQQPDPVMEDEQRLIEWQAGPLADTIKAHLNRHNREFYSHYLQAGSGPALQHDFALIQYAKQIQITDYLEGNRNEIKAWVEHHPEAHDWKPFVRNILVAEGLEPTSERINAREEMVRRSINFYGALDLKNPSDDMRAYNAPLVVSFFVADSATDNKECFEVMTRNAFAMTQIGGLFVATYLGGCKAYAVGDKWVSSADLNEADIDRALLSSGATNIAITKIDTPTLAAEGFDHIFAVTAERQ